MVESIINGTVYLKRTDQSFYTTEDKGYKTIFSGVFGLAHDIPYYFLNLTTPENVPNPHDIHSYSKSYKGRMYLMETPSIGVGSKKVTFKYGLYDKFIICESNKLIIPITNIAYLEYQFNGNTYAAIPRESVTAIQYRFVM